MFAYFHAHAIAMSHKCVLWLLLVSAAIGAFPDLQAADLHLILVADVGADDIGKGVKKDVQSMRKEVQRIGNYTGLQIQEKIFEAQAIDPDAEVKSYLLNLTVQPEDVILFYFSGHGFRTLSDGDNPWPHLYFEERDSQITFREVIEVLAEKQAAFTLLIADCCNNRIKESDKGRQVLLKGKFNKALIQANYSKLFLETKGIIAICGSEAGGYSLAEDDIGSAYTLNFIRQLHDMTRNPPEEVSWRALLDQASSKVRKEAKAYKEKQEPIFSIQLQENL
jgi:hypothetical protein